MHSLRFLWTCVLLLLSTALNYVHLVNVDVIEPCVEKSACSCTNSSHVVDLSPLADLNGWARYVLTPTTSPVKYYWNPCSDLTDPAKAQKSGRCSNVAVCVVSGSHYDNAGAQRRSHLLEKRSPTTQYTHRSPTPSRDVTPKYDCNTDKKYPAIETFPQPSIASISLVCTSDKPGNLKATLHARGIYNFTYKAIHACFKKIVSPAKTAVTAHTGVTKVTNKTQATIVSASTDVTGATIGTKETVVTIVSASTNITGSTFAPRRHHRMFSPGTHLIILFLPLLGVYLILGIGNQVCIAHESGWRVIPNYDMWSGFLAHARDGVIFVITCGKKTPSTLKAPPYEEV